MATATEKQVVPFIPSSAMGPLGIAHLPRLWTKLSLGNAGVLADGWDYCGQGFDDMTIGDLGLDKAKLLDFVKNSKPTYVQFEEYVKANGNTDAATVKKHNDAVFGYNHGDDTCKGIRGATGLKAEGVKDAVTLNMIEDLHELHTQLSR